MINKRETLQGIKIAAEITVLLVLSGCGPQNKVDCPEGSIPPGKSTTILSADVLANNPVASGGRTVITNTGENGQGSENGQGPSFGWQVGVFSGRNNRQLMTGKGESGSNSEFEITAAAPFEDEVDLFPAQFDGNGCLIVKQ